MKEPPPAVLSCSRPTSSSSKAEACFSPPHGAFIVLKSVCPLGGPSEDMRALSALIPQFPTPGLSQEPWLRIFLFQRPWIPLTLALLACNLQQFTVSLGCDPHFPIVLLAPCSTSVWAHQWLCGWRHGRHLSVGVGHSGDRQRDIEEACKAHSQDTVLWVSHCSCYMVLLYINATENRGCVQWCQNKGEAEQKRASQLSFSACAFVLCLVCRALPVSFNTGSLCFRTHTQWALFSDVIILPFGSLWTLRFLWALCVVFLLNCVILNIFFVLLISLREVEGVAGSCVSPRPRKTEDPRTSPGHAGEDRPLGENYRASEDLLPEVTSQQDVLDAVT